MTASEGRGRLEVEEVQKRYGSATAVAGVSLTCRPGEFLTLLGPSGSGKTTILKMVAGFERPDHGRVRLDGRDLTDTPAHRRDIGMVFQQYALFPHMSAAENIAFPLRMRSVARAEVNRRVDEALELVDLAHLAERRPRQLSGGQQQRVALARAIVFRPPILLMDEPLGALDRQLRESLQLEIVRLTRALGITVLFVTHDQAEALAMSDRIAVFRDGRLQQLGTGEELYERPSSLFVARFVGDSNVFTGALTNGAATPRVRGAGWEIAVNTSHGVGPDGTAAAVVVRPERVRVANAGAPREPDCNRLDGTVSEVVYLGSLTRYVVSTSIGIDVTAVVATADDGDTQDLRPGATACVWWRSRDGVVVPSADA